MSAIADYLKLRDAQLLYLLNHKMDCIIMDIIMGGITLLGSLGFAVLIPISLMSSGRERWKIIGFNMAITLIISQVIVYLIKRLVNRPRPYRVEESVIAKWPPACIYSFPSGHTCTAFALSLVMIHFISGFTVIFLGLAILVGISRVYLGVHYPTDVIVGFLIALITFMISMEFIC